MKLYKLVIFVPIAEADKIRGVLALSGAGKTGNYDSTSFSVRGIGRFRPLDGAKPAIGEVGKLEEVEEERIETVVDAELLERVVAAIKQAHPYEEPVIDIYELQ